jgi:hypothetical protein
MLGVVNHDTREAPPTMLVEPRGGACPKCGHSAAESESEPELMGFERTLRSLLRMKPAKARCRVGNEDLSGMPPVPCNCGNPHHGS